MVWGPLPDAIQPIGPLADVPLRQIPTVPETEQLADALRPSLTESTRPAVCLVESGWIVEARPFREGSSLRALLTPLDSGIFAVDINSNYDLNDKTVDWLVCHELGHSLFYRWKEDGQASRNAYGGIEEERFCSRLADKLIGRIALSRAYDTPR